MHLELLGEQWRLDKRLSTTSAMCARCHSGGLTRPILCQNGECSVRPFLLALGHHDSVSLLVVG